ncbi:MAG: signal peptidase I [Thermoanaerobaculaceae bacterium]|nr:signal peptidase I [Thermoanaerobaculaceae bacterium]TAM56840.1 MAG: signal peptidase I [Acidobacteriota bacterium]
MNETIKRRLLWLWNEWVKSLLVVLLVVGAFRSAVADWNDVPTGSMKPTILEGDRIVVNKLAYDLKLPFTRWRLARWGQPRRGDIVVLFSPADGQRLVKRVIGLPGDLLALRNDRLFINGTAVAYEPLTGIPIRDFQRAARPLRLFATEELPDRPHPVMITPEVPAMRFFGPVKVPDGDYFLMGDNRDESGDSRVFGFVPRDSIVGRATAVAASLNPSDHYLPRWHRFLRALR